MSNKLVLIILSCFCVSFSKSFDGPELKTDNELNSLNFGLIGLANGRLYLNKINDIAAYDLNGNQQRILQTYDRNLFQNFLVSDSMLVLSKNQLKFFRISPLGDLLSVSKNFNSFISSADQILLRDSILFIQGNRFSTDVQSEISNRLMPNLQIVKFNKKDNYIVPYNNSRFNEVATSFAVVQDSILFFMNRSINKVNFLDLNNNQRKFDFNFNPENRITTTLSKRNVIYTCNGKSIFIFDYSNSNLNFKSEIK